MHRTILSVEDNALNRELRCSLSGDYNIKEATDSKEALPGFYQAILMDRQMPVLNGHHEPFRLAAIQIARFSHF